MLEHEKRSQKYALQSFIRGEYLTRKSCFGSEWAYGRKRDNKRLKAYLLIFKEELFIFLRSMGIKIPMKYPIKTLAGCLIFICLICPNSFAVIQEDMAKIKVISDEIVKDCPNDEQKVLALSHYVCLKLKPDASKGILPDAQMSVTDRLDSGVGWCNHQIGVFMRLAEAQGIRTRMLYLLNKEGTDSPHTIGEAYLNGRWIIVDPLFDFNIRNDKGELLSLRDVYKDVNLLKRCPSIKERGDVESFIDNYLNPVIYVFGLE